MNRILPGGENIGAAAATDRAVVHKKHRQVRQNPGGQHEDHSIEAQDVEQPEVMDACITQHL